MKPPAVVEPCESMLIATARLPEGSIADMKPEPLMSFSRWIGSPAKMMVRTIDPLMSSLALGSALWSSMLLARPDFGHACQPMSAAPTTAPPGRSCSAGNTCSVGTGGGAGA